MLCLKGIATLTGLFNLDSKGLKELDQFDDIDDFRNIGYVNLSGCKEGGADDLKGFVFRALGTMSPFSECPPLTSNVAMNTLQ
jgi:hypothetical protein